MPAAARVAAVALALLVSPRQRAAAAMIWLEVDATVPDAVTFIAIDGLAIASSSGLSFTVPLKSLVIGPVSVFPPAYDLLSAQSDNVVDRFFARGDDLELNTTSGAEQVLIESERAFKGSASVALPATSLCGDSFIGGPTVRNSSSKDTRLVIGKYSHTGVTPVPVPPSLALMAGARAAALMLRRRRAV